MSRAVPTRANDRVRIIADDRERSAGVIQALDAMEDVQLSIERLSLGDYVVENGLLVERKTVPDVGPVRAAALVDGFGTIEAIATASVRDLATTPGVGPVIAERLKRIVSGGER